MTKIESKKTEANAPAQKVFEFLLDMNNIEKLLPEGKYSEWKSDGNSCSFKMQKAYYIGLQNLSSEPYTGVKYESTQGTPFPFTLDVSLVEENGSTTAQLLCEAQINPFLEMMVKGPLKNLFDYMADKLSSEFSSNA